jgi:hypothetical protein
MSSSVDNQASSLQPAPTPLNRAGALSQVLVPPGHQLQATLHQALNAAALASQVHPGATLLVLWEVASQNLLFNLEKALENF